MVVYFLVWIVMKLRLVAQFIFHSCRRFKAEFRLTGVIAVIAGQGHEIELGVGGAGVLLYNWDIAMGGISKNRIKQVLGVIFRVRTWKLILIMIPVGFLAATLLRFDHLGMVELRDGVLAADESGDEGAIVESLNKLQQYTATHIVVNVVEWNGKEMLTFGTGPFFLDNQYVKRAMEELAKAEASLVGAGDNPNGNVFQKAAAVCDEEGKRLGWGYSKPYIDCMQREIAKYPAMEEIEDYKKAMIPPTALYRQEFASPIWYPTWAGLLILLVVILIVVIIIRFFIWIVLKIVLLIVKK